MSEMPYLYQHADGRSVVATPEAAVKFTTADPSWYRAFPVELHASVAVAEPGEAAASALECAALQTELAAPDDDAAFTAVMIQRDMYHDIADDLAERIAKITGAEIGEHSNINGPWQNAIAAADEFLATPPVAPEPAALTDEHIARVWHAGPHKGAISTTKAIDFVRNVLATTPQGEPAPRAPERAGAVDRSANLQGSLVDKTAKLQGATPQAQLAEGALIVARRLEDKHHLHLAGQVNVDGADLLQAVKFLRALTQQVAPQAPAPAAVAELRAALSGVKRRYGEVGSRDCDITAWNASVDRALQAIATLPQGVEADNPKGQTT